MIHQAEDVWTRHPATGRLERLEIENGHPGPGDYDLPALPGPDFQRVQPVTEMLQYPCDSCLQLGALSPRKPYPRVSRLEPFSDSIILCRYATFHLCP